MQRNTLILTTFDNQQKNENIFRVLFIVDLS